MAGIRALIANALPEPARYRRWKGAGSGLGAEFFTAIHGHKKPGVSGYRPGQAKRRRQEQKPGSQPRHRPGKSPGGS